MDYDTNEFGQNIGRPLHDWKTPQRPARQAIGGRYVRLEPLDPARHVRDLFDAFAADAEGKLWTYHSYGPFHESAEFLNWSTQVSAGSDPLFFALVNQTTGYAGGMASYLNIAPDRGSIEVGHINYSPCMQKTSMATEAMYLMMKQAFDLGYRRYEWKCDAFNEPSRRAAERLGFTFEGIFRQATIVKGRNRDTAWYSIIDREWPAIREAMTAWLNTGNFDDSGRQRTSLSRLTLPLKGGRHDRHR